MVWCILNFDRTNENLLSVTSSQLCFRSAVAALFARGWAGELFRNGSRLEALGGLVTHNIDSRKTDI